ncbi:protein NRT1/ PTR FAMILY 5.10-like isoform X2 [Diospyros lotus]|uniref:protein NRT1/ PTR FAMILY 5.10-like isoform X2 n=1 Tax=Diospyros lotus TaxID=55363 RepID=UPI00224FD984|nr:protein NRT1/ PTR FAMILY 5.10-like isoform X2 [Diospyros lotus]
MIMRCYFQLIVLLRCVSNELQKGLGLLTLSAVLPSFSSSDCLNATNVSPCSPPQLQVVFFFFSLYLVAVAQGGHKPCVQAFGADQFDSQDPQERKAKSSFFNWWYFSLCAGTLTTLWILNYIQDNLSWGLGFGIPCIMMVFALAIFLLGSITYRFGIKSEEKSPIIRIGRVFVQAARNWRTTSSAIAMEEEAKGILPHPGSDQFKFLNKALLAPDGSKEEGKVCSINEVEDAKAVLRLVPIWTTCLVYAIVFAQSSTFFTKQGATMDRSIGPSFDIPAATLQSFISLSIIVFIPIYDRLFVAIARAITQEPLGITMLQRVGTGLLFSTISMVIAAMVEGKRLETAIKYGLVDKPKETVPMSIWWLVPQYAFFGIADVFTMVGLQEFFYDQMPSELKSVGLSLYLSIFGVGSFLSSFLISVVENITGRDGQESWFSSNLNRAHIDYFYWLLAGLSAVALVAYVYFAKTYIYRKECTI